MSVPGGLEGVWGEPVPLPVTYQSLMTGVLNDRKSSSAGLVTLGALWRSHAVHLPSPFPPSFSSPELSFRVLSSFPSPHLGFLFLPFLFTSLSFPVLLLFHLYT